MIELPRGNVPRQLCRWTACSAFAAVEVQQGPRMPFIAVCPTHRRMWDALAFGEPNRMAWQPVRRRKMDDDVTGKRSVRVSANV